MNWYLKVIKEYFNFNGRARRAEYWYYCLFSTIISIVCMILDKILGTTVSMDLTGQGVTELPYGYFFFGYAILTLLPGFGVSVRRLHDIGKSGWWILLVLVPCIGILLIGFLVKNSQPGDNQYGPNPKGE